MVGTRRALLLPSDVCASCSSPREPMQRHRCLMCDAALCGACAVVAPHVKHRRVCAGVCYALGAGLVPHWRVAVTYSPTSPFRGRREPFLERDGAVQRFVSPEAAEAAWRRLDAALHAPSITYAVAGPFTGGSLLEVV